MGLSFGKVPDWINGDGYGSSDGYGYGSGYGSSDGYGYGSGYGSGSGYGYGDGCGDGYGSSDYGSGSGECKEYMQQVLISQGGARAPSLVAEGCVLAFWRSNKDARAANLGSYPDNGPARQVGTIEEIKGPLQICTQSALHASTHRPDKHKGERLWIVAMYPPVDFRGDKVGSLKREILAEIPNFVKDE